jgi:hypothetical protein
MPTNLRRLILSTAFATGLALNGVVIQDVSAQYPNLEVASQRGSCKARLKGDLFARTELFFGLSKSNGSVVTEEEFQQFVNQEVTPRFPDGLTLLSGQGQFRDSNGTIIKEGSKLLILLYPYSSDSNNAIEEIRTAYKTAFQQQSVLRTDEQSCVSF